MGGDPAEDLAEAERLLPGMDDPQYASYCHWGRAWEALVAGRLDDARRDAVAAVKATSYFDWMALPLAARAALWASDLAAASELVDQLASSPGRAQAFELDLVTMRAGVAALEGRRSESISGYRDALRGWRSLGVVFDEALAVVDMAILLSPTDREMAESSTLIEAARETLTGLGANPFLARLEAVPAAQTTARPVSRETPVTTSAEAPVGT